MADLDIKYGNPNYDPRMNPTAMRTGRGMAPSQWQGLAALFNLNRQQTEAAPATPTFAPVQQGEPFKLKNFTPATQTGSFYQGGGGFGPEWNAGIGSLASVPQMGWMK